MPDDNSQVCLTVAIDEAGDERWSTPHCRASIIAVHILGLTAWCTVGRRNCGRGMKIRTRIADNEEMDVSAIPTSEFPRLHGFSAFLRVTPPPSEFRMGHRTSCDVLVEFVRAGSVSRLGDRTEAKHVESRAFRISSMIDNLASVMTWHRGQCGGRSGLCQTVGVEAAFHEASHGMWGWARGIVKDGARARCVQRVDCSANHLRFRR